MNNNALLNAPPPNPPSHDSVALGFFGAVLADIVAGFVLGQSEGAIAVIFLGAIQWLWFIPAIIIFRQQERRRLARGIIIAGSIVFLLNAAGWGICFAMLGKL